MKLQQLDLKNIKNGAAMEMFAHELSRVLENINNPNTEPDATREITMKFTFKPAKDRSSAIIKLGSSSKLAGVRQQATTVYVSRIGDELVAAEFDPRQVTIQEVIEKEASVTPIEEGKKR